MSTPTTRRHPRTLAEAWPREHANPISHYRRHGGGDLIRAIACVAACALIGAMLAQAF
jgi:hypothetical protein